MNQLNLRQKKHKAWLVLIAVLSSLLASFGSCSSQAGALDVAAKKASDFVDSIGVVTKFYPNEKAALWTDTIKPRLQELGVHHIRTTLIPNTAPGLNNQKQADWIVELGRLNPPIKTIGHWRERGTWVEKMKATESMLDGLEAVEGPNEPNALQARFRYTDEQNIQHGQNDRNEDGKIDNFGKGWEHAVRLFTEDLYYHLKDTSNPLYTASSSPIDPRVASLNILSFSPAGRGYEKFKRYQDTYNWNLEDWIDYGNLHIYGAVNPEVVTKNVLDKARRTIYPTKPFIVTEVGYSTDLGHPHGVPNEDVQARYNLRSLLELFRLGVKRTYIFSLLRLEPKGRGFSLLVADKDKHQYEPRASFNAMRDTISILKEESSDFTPGTLRYELSGDLSNVRKDFVLQKSDGTFYLIFWMAVPHDSSSLSRTLKLKINTSGFAEAKLYQPVTQGTSVIQTISDPYAFHQITVPDHPLIVELVPKNL